MARAKRDAPTSIPLVVRNLLFTDLKRRDREFRVEVKFKKADVSAEELFEALNDAAQGIDEGLAS